MKSAHIFHGKKRGHAAGGTRVVVLPRKSPRLQKGQDRKRKVGPILYCRHGTAIKQEKGRKKAAIKQAKIPQRPRGPCGIQALVIRRGGNLPSSPGNQFRRKLKGRAIRREEKHTVKSVPSLCPMIFPGCFGYECEQSEFKRKKEKNAENRES